MQDWSHFHTSVVRSGFHSFQVEHPNNWCTQVEETRLYKDRIIEFKSLKYFLVKYFLLAYEFYL